MLSPGLAGQSWLSLLQTLTVSSGAGFGGSSLWVSPGNSLCAPFPGVHLVPAELGLPQVLPAPRSPALCITSGLRFFLFSFHD